MDFVILSPQRTRRAMEKNLCAPLCPLWYKKKSITSENTESHRGKPSVHLCALCGLKK
jgi:hypothetical protein